MSIIESNQINQIIIHDDDVNDDNNPTELEKQEPENGSHTNNQPNNIPAELEKQEPENGTHTNNQPNNIPAELEKQEPENGTHTNNQPNNNPAELEKQEPENVLNNISLNSNIRSVLAGRQFLSNKNYRLSVSNSRSVSKKQHSSYIRSLHSASNKHNRKSKSNITRNDELSNTNKSIAETHLTLDVSPSLNSNLNLNSNPISSESTIKPRRKSVFRQSYKHSISSYRSSRKSKSTKNKDNHMLEYGKKIINSFISNKNKNKNKNQNKDVNLSQHKPTLSNTINQVQSYDIPYMKSNNILSKLDMNSRKIKKSIKSSDSIKSSIKNSKKNIKKIDNKSFDSELDNIM